MADYNYEIHAADGRLVEKSNLTSWPKASAVREASDLLAKGVGAYALITSFDWRRGNRVCGKITAQKGA